MMYNKYSLHDSLGALGEMYVKAIFHDNGVGGSFHHA